MSDAAFSLKAILPVVPKLLHIQLSANHSDLSQTVYEDEEKQIRTPTAHRFFFYPVTFIKLCRNLKKNTQT